MSEEGSRLLLQPLRRTLRLAAAQAGAYAPGKRVMMHSGNDRIVWCGYILEPLDDTPADHRRVEWDDDWISTVPVTELELIKD